MNCWSKKYLTPIGGDVHQPLAPSPADGTGAGALGERRSPRQSLSGVGSHSIVRQLTG